MSAEITNQSSQVEASPNAQVESSTSQQQVPQQVTSQQSYDQRVPYPQQQQQQQQATNPSQQQQQQGQQYNTAYYRSYPTQNGYYPEQYQQYYQQQQQQQQQQSSTGSPNPAAAAAAAAQYSSYYQQQAQGNQPHQSPQGYYKTPIVGAPSVPYDYSRYAYVQGYSVYPSTNTAAASLANINNNNTPVLTQSTSSNVGQIQPVGARPKVTTTMWEDEKTVCYQVEANGVSVVRRADNNMINGTKLLNVAHMTRGRRDGLLKSEKVRHVVKIGSMHLKGVWIPFDRALAMAQKEKIVDLLYPLFVRDIKRVIQQGSVQASGSAASAVGAPITNENESTTHTPDETSHSNPNNTTDQWVGYQQAPNNNTNDQQTSDHLNNNSSTSIPAAATANVQTSNGTNSQYGTTNSPNSNNGTTQQSPYYQYQYNSNFYQPYGSYYQGQQQQPISSSQTANRSQYYYGQTPTTSSVATETQYVSTNSTEAAPKEEEK